MEMPKQVARKIIYESDWICLYADTVQMPSGEIIETYHQLHYPYESCGLVVLNEKDEILLIQSKRYTTQSIEWEIPAGRIEIGETVAFAAKRECYEETGCMVDDLKHLCTYYPSNGMSDLQVHIYEAKVSEESNHFDTNEVKDKKWISKKEIREMLKENQITCGMTMTALLYALYV